ncbi:MAG: hypothetical protein COV45_01905 [Deltaproteobacteria bacterium CG11_big_fil_rev_8_21_14_0_20_47_16]|nr:MAG: hypothetical protein COV45_01905 [Deltaproteobacteria bacterium CG11_big_fil_rev_8_21_14_0_20_47_16]
MSRPVALLNRVFEGVTSLFVSEAYATPQYSRQTGLSCGGCHSVAPKLNQGGENFIARGYRMSPDLEVKMGGQPPSVPLSAWVTGRHERQIAKEYDDTLLPKVELISGGSISPNLSYFAEWRPVSLSARKDGTHQDRGGRFEDLFINWLSNSGRHSVRVGQFRPLNQLDVSRRLSVSEPTALSTSLPGTGDAHPDKRVQSLRSFSPSGRSPAVAYTFQSIAGDSPSDGLSHTITLPVGGEFSLPLSPGARKDASFEFEPKLKGVFLETAYRYLGVNTLGVHTFIGNDRWLASALGTANYGGLYATALFGIDKVGNAPARQRVSAELEYLPRIWSAFCPGVGFRFEHITNAKKEPAYIPYFVLSGINTVWAVQLQVEGRIQKDNDALIVDVSTLF